MIEYINSRYGPLQNILVYPKFFLLGLSNDMLMILSMESEYTYACMQHVAFLNFSSMLIITFHCNYKIKTFFIDKKIKVKDDHFVNHQRIERQKAIF